MRVEGGAGALADYERGGVGGAWEYVGQSSLPRCMQDN